jgi:hypothetical protein
MLYREGSFGTYAEDTFGTLKACGGNNGGGGSETLIVENKAAYGVVSKGNGDCFTMEEKHMSLTTGGGQAGQGYPCVLTNKPIILNDQGGSSMNIEKDCVSPTLRAEPHNHEPIVFHTMQDPISSDTVTPCISAGSPNGQAVVGVNVDYTVRRLTPLECERLQGYPDGWTLLPQIDSMSNDTYNFWCSVLFEKAKIEGRVRWNADTGIYEIWREVAKSDESGSPKVWENTEKPYKHKTPAQMLNWYNKMVDGDSSDAARYKAIGNSIALPPWEFVLQRLSICCGDNVTMASLFDGIGGFPLIWERLNGAGSCLWSSEIEEFPIAVTKQHFNEEG